MRIKGRFDSLAERERKLVLVFLSILGAMFVLLLPILLRLGVSEQIDQNDRLRAVLQEIGDAREMLAKRQAATGRVEDRYRTPAPPLAGYLAQLADDVGVDIPETQDRSTVPRGKTFKERSSHIRLAKVGMLKLSNFMERVSSSPFPVMIAKLEIKKRGGKPDEYDADMDVTAFDREEKKTPKKAAARSAAGRTQAEEDKQ